MEIDWFTVADHRNEGKMRLWVPAELLCGGIAGWAGQTLSYPFEIIRRTMQISGRISAAQENVSSEVSSRPQSSGHVKSGSLDTRETLAQRASRGKSRTAKGLADTIKEIYAKRGPRGFFVGLTIGYIKVVPMSAVSFMVFEGVNRFLL